MKKYVLGFLGLAAVGIAFSIPAMAQGNLMVAATMQHCAATEDCALVTNSCSDNCAFVPINKTNMPAMQSQYQQRCGKDMGANPTCNMNPPIKAACINSRCTIDYSITNNASAADYQSGAYPVAEQPTQSQVKGDYSKVDDTKGGFTAYQLPQNEVKEKTVGTITTKIYVPPSAPVSGGNYIPVTPTAASAPAASNIPPAAVPTTQTYAAPPQAVAAPSVPATPNAAAATAPASGTTSYEYVPAQTPPTVPAPGLPRAPVAPAVASPAATTPAVPSVGATGVPQAPPGSVPIPPSDLKPAPSLAPAPGTTVPANPEDPGAKPQFKEGAELMPIPTEDGNLALVQKQPAVTTASSTVKSFAGLPAKTSKSVGTND